MLNNVKKKFWFWQSTGFICDCQTAATLQWLQLISLSPKLTLIAFWEAKSQLLLSAIRYPSLELHFSAKTKGSWNTEDAADPHAVPCLLRCILMAAGFCFSWLATSTVEMRERQQSWLSDTHLEQLVGKWIETVAPNNKFRHVSHIWVAICMITHV